MSIGPRAQDVIELRGLAVDTVIGIHPWEQRVRQRLLLDLDLPINAADTEDDIERTLDYDAAAAWIRDFVRDSSRQLLEALADDLARALLERFALPWVELSIDKPGAVPDCTRVRLRIRRQR